MSDIHDDMTAMAWRASEEAGLNDRANQTVAIQFSNPTSSHASDDGYVGIRITDFHSGETLVDVEIPAGRFYRLMQGGQQQWPAFVSPNLNRIGKRLETRMVPLGRAWDLKTDEEAQQAAADADRDLFREGWESESYSVRKTNAGWECVYRRWVEREAVNG